MEPEANNWTQPEGTPQLQQTGPKPPRSLKPLAVVLLVAALGGATYLLRIGPIRKAHLGVQAAEAQRAKGGDIYYCPMHPEYKSDKPGNCPICSMKLQRLEQPATTAAPAGGHQHGATPAPASAEGTSQAGAIFIAPQRQQLIGVKSVPAEVKPLVKEIRTVGKVTHDETRITHIHTKVTGYIEEVFVDYAGKPVKRGDPLFTIYSPDLVSTQEEYLLALKSRQALQGSAFPWIASGSVNLVEAARRRLRLWDITEQEIDALEKDGQVKRALTIFSPVTGIVIERAAYHHGRFVNPEMDLYTIVDLSNIWVLAEIYEYDLPLVRAGQTAEVEFPYASGAQPLRGKVSYLYPHLNPKTRTTQVRMEFPNPDLTLRPDMFFNVKLKVDLGRQVVVPEDAVLDTGTQQYVFVDKGEGYFEPRSVKLGAEAGGYFAIQSGLKAGERVVTAANFVLDSESRLKGALANMGKPELPQAAGAGAAGTQALSVEIREPKEAKVGRNNLRLLIRDSSGQPVEGAEVEVMLLMPQMGSMPPMTTRAALRSAGKGEYAGTVEIPMAWTWQTTVTVRKSGNVLGTVQTQLQAR
jgi:RND family efflux transporter MFP subunit